MLRFMLARDLGIHETVWVGRKTRLWLIKMYKFQGPSSYKPVFLKRRPRWIRYSCLFGACSLCMKPVRVDKPLIRSLHWCSPGKKESREGMFPGNKIWMRVK